MGSSVTASSAGFSLVLLTGVASEGNPLGVLFLFWGVLRCMDFIVAIAGGIFRVMEGDTLPTAFPDGEDPIPLDDIFEKLSGRAVKLMVHHTPLTPPHTLLPGGGACLWPPGMCPAGHNKDAQWLHRQLLEGVLESRGGKWFVGESQVLFSPLEGHRAQVYLVTTGVSVERPTGSSETADLESLLQQAGDMTSTLESLKSYLGEGD